MSAESIYVVAGALLDFPRILIAQRPPGKHMAGGWEFPGGKLHRGESVAQCLHRELREELGVQVLDASPVIQYEHQYDDRTVLLDLWLVTKYSGAPVAAEGQAIQWVDIAALDDVGLLAADKPMIEPLRAAIKDYVAGT